MTDGLRLLLVGIDGAAHPVVQRLLAEGRLPNLRSVAGDGLFGPLESTFPPHTAPGWVSAFTGVGPGRHGIFQFWPTQWPEYRPPVVSARQIEAEPLWSMLERHGVSVGVVNVPMTHPPCSLRSGYMVSWPLSPTIHYSEPPTLLRELATAGTHYRSDLACMFRGEPDYPERAARFIEDRTKVLMFLMEHRPVEVLVVVYTEVDRISHHFWGDREDPSDVVVRGY